MSGSSPENTVTEAREMVATFNVRMSSGAMAEASPPKSRVTTKRYPVWEKTPRAKRNSTSPATLARRVVAITSRKHPSRKGMSLTNQGTRPKNRYQASRIRGSRPAMTVSSLP